MFHVEFPFKYSFTAIFNNGERKENCLQSSLTMLNLERDLENVIGRNVYYEDKEPLKIVWIENVKFIEYPSVAKEYVTKLTQKINNIVIPHHTKEY